MHELKIFHIISEQCDEFSQIEHAQVGQSISNNLAATQRALWFLLITVPAQKRVASPLNYTAINCFCSFL